MSFMTRKTDKRFLPSFTKPLLPLEEAHIVSSVNIPPPTTTTNAHLRLRNAMAQNLAFLFHTCIVTTDTLISRVQFDLAKRLWQLLFHLTFLYLSLPLFCLYSLLVIVVLVVKVLWKNRSDVNWSSPGRTREPRGTPYSTLRRSDLVPMISTNWYRWRFVK